MAEGMQLRQYSKFDHSINFLLRTAKNINKIIIRHKNMHICYVAISLVPRPFGGGGKGLGTTACACAQNVVIAYYSNLHLSVYCP